MVQMDIYSYYQLDDVAVCSLKSWCGMHLLRNNSVIIEWTNSIKILNAESFNIKTQLLILLKKIIVHYSHLIVEWICSRTDADGVIFINCRSSRRRILNEAELVDALHSVAKVDLIDFAGMTFRDQAISFMICLTYWAVNFFVLSYLVGSKKFVYFKQW